ncbi:mannosyl-glycoprotein endo-beta-N-acetylglucosamidase, partial [Staphylococcus pseudintermedius]|nr:mannosyl-glycoprotein endo-beta-N-acetylglucosamidase [Staphylococcus pseudintermedius]
MASKKQTAKKVIASTPIAMKLKLIKVIIIFVVMALLLLPVIMMIILAPSLKEDVDDAGCTVAGGNVEKSGIEVFEQNAKGGALEGKTKKIV